MAIRFFENKKKWYNQIMMEGLKPRIYLSKQEKIMKNFSLFFLALTIIFCLSIALFNASFSVAEVSGRSMMPTLNYELDKTDLVYYSSWFKPTNGDIIIVNPLDSKNDWIKRLIAVGGDTLSFGDIDNTGECYIYLNGERLEEDYLFSQMINRDCVNRFKNMIKDCIEKKDSPNEQTLLKYEWLSQNDDGEWQINLPNDYCVYLGDNREGSNSYDCSFFGPQKTSTIIGKVMIVVPYGYDLITYISAKFFGAV